MKNAQTQTHRSTPVGCTDIHTFTFIAGKRRGRNRNGAKGRCKEGFKNGKSMSQTWWEREERLKCEKKKKEKHLLAITSVRSLHEKKDAIKHLC